EQDAAVDVPDRIEPVGRLRAHRLVDLDVAPRLDPHDLEADVARARLAPEGDKQLLGHGLRTAGTPHGHAAVVPAVDADRLDAEAHVHAAAAQPVGDEL